MKATQRAEFGDFQTPLALAQQVCEIISASHEQPDVIVEPTCGRGAFLLAASQSFPAAQLHGWEINADYVAHAESVLAENSARTFLRCADFFACDWERELSALKGKLLILGNPPWVTSSAVSAMNGQNLPVKENFLGLRGMAAKTGKANFDISEWMLIQLLRCLKGRESTIAVLCKTGTARKFLRYAWQNHGQVREAELRKIDASLHFDASVDACLLIVKTGGAGSDEAAIYESLDAQFPARHIGLAGKDLVADLHTYRKLRHLEGLCPFQWRSGLKHDCAAVMEFHLSSTGDLENGLHEKVMLESSHLFPLLKCTDLSHGRFLPSKKVLVPQRRMGDDTAAIESDAPLTWKYLQRHASKLDARKSSIYRGKSRFAIFGIGEYAFAPWKVAVSGLHPHARFIVVPPVGAQPVMFDDTCYYLSFQEESMARLIAQMLNSIPCQAFIASLVFRDSKRPVTAELLQRLNFNEIAAEAGFGKQWQQAHRTNTLHSSLNTQMELVMETPAKYVVEPQAIQTRTAGDIEFDADELVVAVESVADQITRRKRGRPRESKAAKLNPRTS